MFVSNLKYNAWKYTWASKWIKNGSAPYHEVQNMGISVPSPTRKKLMSSKILIKIFITVSNIYLQGAYKGLTTIQEFTAQEFGSVNITRFGVLGGSKVCI